MTNTHRKTTTGTTAKIAAVGAFGIGAALAFPGIAAAQEPTEPAGSLDDAIEAGSSATTGLEVDLGSLTFNLNLDAETPTPGSVEFGSLGVSPNTGSDMLDSGAADSGSSLPGSSADETTGAETGSTAPGSSEDETTGDETTTPEGPLGSLSGLSSGADAGDGTNLDADAEITTGSLG